jgi:hypothetical protein
MNAPKFVRDDLSISYKNQALTDPYVAVLEVASTGRSGIPSASFDNGRSLQLSFDSKIETILSTEYKPISATKPVIEAQESKIEVRPELIARREIISISILTDGDPGFITVSLNPFADVKVETADRETTRARRARWLTMSTSALAALSVLATGAGIYYTFRSVNKSRALSDTTICLSLTEFDQTVELGLQLVQRDIAIHRTDAGLIKSLTFSPEYNTDVGTLQVPGSYLAVEYGIVGGESANRTAVGIHQVLNMLPKLPREGTGEAASRGIAELHTVMHQISNPPNPQALGCPL